MKRSETSWRAYLAGIFPALPSVGAALSFFRVNAAGTAWETRTPAETLSDIGAQPLDADLTALAALGDGIPSRASSVWSALASTGTGDVVRRVSPTLITPNLDTPSAITLINAIGLPVGSGISGLGAGVATALAVNVGSAGAPVVNGGALGTPSSGTATNLTGLPIDSGTVGTLPINRGGTNATSAVDAIVALGASTSVPTLAALKALTTRPASVFMIGSASALDGRGGTFVWEAGSTTTPDDVDVVQCTAGDAGRYKRVSQYSFFQDVGRMFDDVGANSGGLRIGGPTGVWIKQEGAAADYETGSLAIYSLTPDRWTGLSVCPSGDPWDVVAASSGENIASLGLQIVNGADEERVVFTSKWFGDEATGTGEYRIAAIKTGTGRYWPITISNNDVWLAKFNADETVDFTNETFAGASGGNTVVNFKNPGITASFRAVARASDGVVGFERLTSGTPDYEFQLHASGPRIVGTAPTLWWSESDAGTDEKKWFLDASGGVLRGVLANDAETAFSGWLNVYRSAQAFTNICLGGDYTNAPVQISSSGVGFFSTAPAAKQAITGSLSTVAAADVKAVLTSIIAALSTCGLMTDSTT